MYFACFRPADHRVESEPMENFQDLEFEDLEQPAGFEGGVLDACCTDFSYLSIGLHAGSVVWWEYRCVISFRILSLLPGFWVEY